MDMLSIIILAWLFACVFLIEEDARSHIDEDEEEDT